MTLNIIHEKCEKKAADDKTLPRNAYLVTYLSEDKISYDITMAANKSEIFDHYWDKYKEGLQDITWAKGNIRPNLWNPNGGKKEKTAKRKKK